MPSTLKDDKVLMATLALRGVRFKRIMNGRGLWLQSGWYWKTPQTQWVGRFTTRREMLSDAKNWFERRDSGNPVSFTRWPQYNAQEAIERA